MAIFNTLPDNLGEVDIIVAGGGTAGCVIATRLAEADPSLTILVVERGTNNDSPTVTYPMLFLSHIMPGSPTALWYPAGPEEQLGGRSIPVSTGGILGGGSSINMMTYSRGQRSDFDAWNMPGWSADGMIPYMKKFETYNGPGTPETHGYDGPVQVSRGRFINKSFEDKVIAAAAEVGYPEVQDAQSMDSINVFERVHRYVSKDGKRQDAATCYLHPLLQSGKCPNLHVLLETQVVRVLFDETKRASGVEIRPTPEFQGKDGLIKTVSARKLVIVSAGAVATPALLERSGVGSRDILEKAGVKVVADNKGVGMEYHDHVLALASYYSSLEPSETLDSLSGGRLNVPELMEKSDPVLDWTVQDTTSKLRPTDAEVEMLGEDFKKAWDQHFKDIPTKPVVAITSIAGWPGNPADVPVGQYISTTSFTTHPYSYGHVHITGPSLDDPLDFHTGIFKNPLDCKCLMWAFKKQREIIRRLDCYRGELEIAHPVYSEISNARSIKLDAPLPRPVKDIEYTAEDDAVLEAWLYKTVANAWHSIGTCKMAPEDKGGAVDGSLNVYGVSGLKLADLSIAPGNISANTANTAFAVGEKAAAIFIAELGLE
ncbi:hypothetical protein B0I35DRAFT_427718 [Stachybotrys elegans]|uniref:Glucose-methanol-choline oxidoreductase N-terminal domain-containing protein n=1 Tax=Stachybotrys elegans TaxID=80388 RepID=A0A8K0SPP7_9HYPO|nr:hypothetical protein B0I35DRAFT_427718 [Stachybotrys elegans]